MAGWRAGLRMRWRGCETVVVWRWTRARWVAAGFWLAVGNAAVPCGVRVCFGGGSGVLPGSDRHGTGQDYYPERATFGTCLPRCSRPPSPQAGVTSAAREACSFRRQASRTTFRSRAAPASAGDSGLHHARRPTILSDTAARLGVGGRHQACRRPGPAPVDMTRSTAEKADGERPGTRSTTASGGEGARGGGGRGDEAGVMQWHAGVGVVRAAGTWVSEPVKCMGGSRSRSRSSIVSASLPPSLTRLPAQTASAGPDLV